MKGSVGPRVIGVKSSGQRRVGDLQQQVVLPEAERQGDAEDGERDDDPVAQLVEVLDEGEPVLVGDGLEPGHSRPPQLRLSATTSPSTGSAASPSPLAGGFARSSSGTLSSVSVSVVLVLVVAADRAAELADPLAQRAAQLRQALGPEHDERDDQDDQDFEWSDVRHDRNGNAGSGRSDQAGPEWVRTCRLRGARCPRSSGRSGSASAPPGPGTCCRSRSDP